MSTPPKVTNRFVIPIKIPNIANLVKMNLKCIENCKRSRIDEAILINKNKAGGITIPGFKTCYRAVIIKTPWFWHNNCVSANGIEYRSQELINWYQKSIHNLLIFDNWAKILPGKRTVSSTNGIVEIGSLHVEIWNKTPTLHSMQSSQRTGNHQITGENHRGNTARHWHSSDFLHKIPEAQAMKAKIDKLNYIRLRSFSTAKKTLEVKRQKNGENICKLCNW